MLKSLFEAAFNEWSLAHKEGIGVINNVRNITKAWQLLEKQSIIFFAHTMKLAVKKGMDVAPLDCTLMKARKLHIVSHFQHSAIHSEAFKNQQEMLNLP